MAKFNQMVKEFRESIKQTPEGVALLLQIRPADYLKLEEDWIPPEDLLERVCSLFSWNYQDIRRTIATDPNAPASMRSSAQPVQRESLAPRPPSDFNTMLRESREEIGQSPEAIAMLLNMQLQEYLDLEHNRIPTDQVLQKICSMFGWNYRQVRQRLIINTSPPIVATQQPLTLQELQSLRESRAVQEADIPLRSTPANRETLGENLRRARETIGQSTQAIAMLLNIDDATYEAFENGMAPSPDMLRRIAALFRWNYNELRILVNTENIQQFQPTVHVNKSGQQAATQQLSKITKEIQQTWPNLSAQQQQSLLAQLDLIKETARRFSAERTASTAVSKRPPAKPANPTPQSGRQSLKNPRKP